MACDKHNKKPNNSWSRVCTVLLQTFKTLRINISEKRAEAERVKIERFQVL